MSEKDKLSDTGKFIRQMDGQLLGWEHPATRLREDPIFRDAGHHFLRAFDKAFVSFEATATDGDLIDLSDTRTARAFMLLGRVTGTFD